MSRGRLRPLLGLIVAVGGSLGGSADAARIRKIVPPCAGVGAPVVITGRGLRNLQVMIGGVRAVVIRQRPASETILVPGGVPPGPTSVELVRKARRVARAQFQVAGPTGCASRAAPPTGPVGCTPGTMQACYDGPAGTEGVGICHAGTQTCDPSGTFGPCQGEVLPATEIPGNGIDEDCNGTDMPGGGEFCTPGDVQTCYDGPPGTLGVGVCQAGMRMCNAGLLGICEGEILPTPDLTVDGIDQNCDGQDGIVTRNLLLQVNPALSPTFQTSAVITGMVGTSLGPPTNPPPTPLIASLQPAQAHQGDTLDVTVTGQNTSFQPGLLQLNFGSGITVNGITVNGPTQATVNVTVPADAALGPRLVSASTGTQEALLANAFTILAGLGTVTGTVVDGNGHPIAGAQVCIDNTTICATTGADGTFSLPGVPTTASLLDVDAAGFDHFVTPIAVALDGTATLGNVPIGVPDEPPPPPPPNAPPIGPALASVLGRGFTEIAQGGNPLRLRKLVQDVIIAVGSDEAGVLDANGNQMNPLVQGAGRVSLIDRGVGDIAEQLIGGDTRTLGQILTSFLLSFDYNGLEAPHMIDLIQRLQQEVNADWADPSLPGAPLMFALFNQGRAPTAAPPQLQLVTTLNAAQSYLLVTSLLGFTNRELQEGAAAVGGTIVTRAASRAPRFVGVVRQAPPALGGFTIPWVNIFTDIAKKQLIDGTKKNAVELCKNFIENPNSTTTTTLPGVPSFLTPPKPGCSQLADLVQILVTNETDAKTMASTNFAKFFQSEKVTSANAQRIQQQFQSSSFQDGFKSARIAASDFSKGQQLLSKFIGFGTSFVENIFTQIQGDLAKMVFNQEVALIVEAMRPAPPFIRTVKQRIDPTTGLGENVVTISFDRSENDHGANAPSNQTWFYQLYRQQNGGIVLVDSGRVRTTGSGPRPCTTTPLPAEGCGNPPVASDSTLYFTDPAAPDGTLLYRVRARRLIGTIPSSNPTDPGTQALFQILGTFLPQTLTTAGGASIFSVSTLQTILDPVAQIIDKTKFQSSELSDPGRIFVSTQPLPPQPLADLAVDQNRDRLYVSLAPLHTIFQVQDRVQSSFVDTNFKSPFQAGLAIDTIGNVYTDNAASDPLFGGRIFSFSGFDGSRSLVGTVQKYSFLLGFARPVSVQALAGGFAPEGEVVYVADGFSGTVKKLRTQVPFDRNLNVAQPFAASGDFNFATGTHMAVRGDGTVAIAQDVNVFIVPEDASFIGPLFDGPSFPFGQVSGVAFDRYGDMYLSDAITGNIVMLTIPQQTIHLGLVGVLPIQRKKQTVVRGLTRPTDVTLAPGRDGLAFFDAERISVLPFGMSGQLTDTMGQPLPNAVVLAPDLGKSTVTDSDGVFILPGLLSPGEPPVVKITIKANNQEAGIQVALEDGKHNIIDLVFDPKPPMPGPTPPPVPGADVKPPPTDPNTVLNLRVKLEKVGTPPPVQPACPRARILLPVDGEATTDTTVSAQGFVTDPTIGQGAVLVNGVPTMTMTNAGDFQVPITLTTGGNQIAYAVLAADLKQRGCLDASHADSELVVISEAVDAFVGTAAEVQQFQAARAFDTFLVGRVVDDDTSLPVAGLNFTVPSSGTSTMTDRDGVFVARFMKSALGQIVQTETQILLDDVKQETDAINTGLQAVANGDHGAALDAFGQVLILDGSIADAPPDGIPDGNALEAIVPQIDASVVNIFRALQLGADPDPNDVAALQAFVQQLAGLGAPNPQRVLIKTPQAQVTITLNVGM